MQNKICIIMRGWPGSGKSTLAKKIATHFYKKGQPAFIASADNYFTDPVTGKYDWRKEEIDVAHRYCKSVFREAVNMGQVVIVDNTNLQRKYYEYYVNYAKAYGYKVFQALPTTVWQHDIEACQKYTVESGHSVPLATIRSMQRDFEQDDGLGLFDFPSEPEDNRGDTTGSQQQTSRSQRT